jgi:hypothetical protein
LRQTGRQADMTKMLGSLHEYANALEKHLSYSRHTVHKLNVVLRWVSTIASLSDVYTPVGVLFLDCVIRSMGLRRSQMVSFCIKQQSISWPGSNRMVIFVRSNAARYIQVTN